MYPCSGQYMYLGACTCIIHASGGTFILVYTTIFSTQFTLQLYGIPSDPCTQMVCYSIRTSSFCDTVFNFTSFFSTAHNDTVYRWMTLFTINTLMALFLKQFLRLLKLWSLKHVVTFLLIQAQNLLPFLLLFCHFFSSILSSSIYHLLPTNTTILY